VNVAAAGADDARGDVDEKDRGNHRERLNRPARAAAGEPPGGAPCIPGGKSSVAHRTVQRHRCCIAPPDASSGPDEPRSVPPPAGVLAGRIAVDAGGYPGSMSADDKAANKIDELAGKAKETVGRATGNPDLEDAGKREQAKSNLKQAGEKVKDAFK
jgi:uncharacterized protein YjbJ (UPF0337 family)